MPGGFPNALIQIRSLRRLPTRHVNASRYISDLFRNPSRGNETQVAFSGIQPTGIPHLGNYLGALRPWVKLQNDERDKKRCVFSVVDLHALTVPQNAQNLAQWRKNTFASLLAIGLDYQKSTIFLQSDVSVAAMLAGLCLRS